MKERKEALVKNKASEVDTELKTEVDKQQSSRTLQYSGLGIIFLLTAGGVAYYLYTHKKSPPAEPLKKNNRKFGWNKPIINMSKPFDYKKELKDSLIDASLLTTSVYSLAWIGSKLGISKPTLAMSAENIGKIVIYLTASDMLKDYLKQQKIIPGM